MRLLIVEDNRRLVANLFEYFEAQGHALDAAPDGVMGKWLASTQQYDAIVLDRMLPRLDGCELLRQLREEVHLDTPVIMLTARAELADKVDGFKAGADDYLTKPFELQELELRLHALVARAKGSRAHQRRLQVADLTFDLDTLEVTRAGQSLHLYPMCRVLLRALMEASPAIVSRAQLEDALWGDNPPDRDRLRAYVHELRRQVDTAFDLKLIHTVPRTGYRIAAR
jgi:DNA-binding response OmpR family regulator